MTIEEAVRTYLIADTPLAALVAQRIYPIVAPQTITTDYVLYERVSGNPFQDHGGSGSLSWVRLGFLACATTYTAAKAIAAAIRTRLDGYHGTLSGIVVASILSEEDADVGLDDVTRMQVVSIDFRIMYYA